MSTFASILVPLDGSRIAARSLGCALWLAARLDARVHVLSATPRELPAREELARLRVPEAHWPRIVLHQAPAYPEEAILATVARHHVELVVMTAAGETAEAAAIPDASRIVGHVARAVIERSPVPVLLLPRNYREALPWTRLLVPVSGEAVADEALALAVRVASALHLEVHVAHVTGTAPDDESLAARARYADALHHEYPRQLEEFIRRALPWCGPDECRRITEVALCRGDVAAELRALIERTGTSALVVGWRGRFMAGHARVLKELIEAISAPVLLVKAAPGPPVRLNVGEDVE
jgi:nucleotide-binding universal stress UspA family protein